MSVKSLVKKAKELLEEARRMEAKMTVEKPKMMRKLETLRWQESGRSDGWYVPASEVPSSIENFFEIFGRKAKNSGSLVIHGTRYSYYFTPSGSLNKYEK